MRLDYISCVLTIGSTVLIGRRYWQGWLIAAANSVIICYIGLLTEQTGFIPANLFCLGIYGYNVYQWRTAKPKCSTEPEQSQPAAVSGTLMRSAPRHRTRDSGPRRKHKQASHVPATHDRIRPRELSVRE